MFYAIIMHIESGLSPPYDGSEMDNLFPDLVGVEHGDQHDQCNKESGMEIAVDFPSPDNNNEDESDLLSYLLNKMSSSVSQVAQGNGTSDKDDEIAIINDSDEHQHGKTERSSSRRRHGSSVGTSRVPSPVEEDEPGLNRNALMARLNRLKKKKYLQELETSVKSLKVENESLKKDKKKMAVTLEKLHTEVRYLKSVIANQSELSSLLQNIGVTGLRLHSSFPRPSSKMPLKPSTTRNLPVKRGYEPDRESETESESETIEEQRKHPRNDHDYTIPMSPKEQILHAKNKAVKVKDAQVTIDEDSTSTQPPKVRAPLTRYAKTVTTRSGHNVTQTVVKVDGVEENKAVGTNQVRRPRTRRATRSRDRLSREAESTAGVCLHVSSGSVSLEFCAGCSDRAKAAVMAEEEIIKVVE